MDKVERRGGFRPGSGRKPTIKTGLSAYQVAKMLRKAKKMASRVGKDIDDVLLEFIYHADGRVQDRLAAIKLWKEYAQIKPSEGGEADKQLGPAVFLPEHHPRLSIVKTDAA